MPVVPPTSVPPHVARDITGFARALMAAIRARQMYGADHPSANASAERLWHAAEAVAVHPKLDIGVSPIQLLVNGEGLPPDRRVAEAAALLHDHDILRLRVARAPTLAELGAFLQLLGFDPESVRRRGGPARLWGDFGHSSLELDQIDYEAILAMQAPPASRQGGPDSSRLTAAAPVQRLDGVWNALVKSMSSSKAPYSRGVRERLRQIAQSADDIFALATEAAQAVSAADAPNQEAAQAATVLTAFERLVNQVEETAPEQVSETIRRIATAASRMDPRLVMDAVAESADSGLGGPVMRAMGDAFDDDDVARLLAASMAKEGRATGRMAAALSTLAPDPERQLRVLRLASQMTDAAGGRPASDAASAWHDLGTILSGPADTLYTSADYAFQLQESSLRSHRLRLESPEHLDAWVASVSSDSMRTLSITLLLDLFAIEDSPVKIIALASDLAAWAENLLAAADLDEALRIIRATDPASFASDPRRAAAARQALDALAGSPALRDLGAALGDLDDGPFEGFRSCCTLIGPGVVPTLLPSLVTAPDGLLRDRLSSVISGFGEAAATPIVALLGSVDWDECRTGIQLLGRIGGRLAALAMAPLVASQDPQRARAAVAALLRLDDPVAMKSLAAALTSGTRDVRYLVVDALISAHDRRASGLLTLALRATPPIGRDHALVLQVLAALRRIGDDQAVLAIAESMQAFNWIRLRRTMTLKRTAVSVLASLPYPNAAEALARAARQGDVLLRRYAGIAMCKGG